MACHLHLSSTFLLPKTFLGAFSVNETLLWHLFCLNKNLLGVSHGVVRFSMLDLVSVSWNSIETELPWIGNPTRVLNMTCPVSSSSSCSPLKLLFLEHMISPIKFCGDAGPNPHSRVVLNKHWWHGWYNLKNPYSINCHVYLFISQLNLSSLKAGMYRFSLPFPPPPSSLPARI